MSTGRIGDYLFSKFSHFISLGNKNFTFPRQSVNDQITNFSKGKKRLLVKLD